MKATCTSMFCFAIVCLIGLNRGDGIAAQVSSDRTPVFDTASEVFISVEEMIERLMTADVIYVGESHTDYAHHLAQLEILKELHEARSTVVMGWEMFHSSQQPLLDAYIGGWLPEVEWLDAIYWEETWGFPYPYYKPLLDFARDNDLRIFGLNAPRSAVRGVRTLGREGMTEDLSYWLPPGFWNRLHVESEMQYEEWFMENARHSEDVTDEQMELMFRSQTAWNEIMAWNVVKAFNVMPDLRLKVMVVVGSGHAMFGQGVPTRVELFKSDLDQVVVMPYTSDRVIPLSEIREEELDRRGDYIWFVPPAGDPPGLVRPEGEEGPPPHLP